MSPDDLAKRALEVDLDTVDSAIIRKLIEEVRQDPEGMTRPGAYDRIHNRHNR